MSVVIILFGVGSCIFWYKFGKQIGKTEQETKKYGELSKMIDELRDAKNINRDSKLRILMMLERVFIYSNKEYFKGDKKIPHEK